MSFIGPRPLNRNKSSYGMSLCSVYPKQLNLIIPPLLSFRIKLTPITVGDKAIQITLYDEIFHMAPDKHSLNWSGGHWNFLKLKTLGMLRIKSFKLLASVETNNKFLLKLIKYVSCFTINVMFDSFIVPNFKVHCTLSLISWR